MIPESLPCPVSLSLTCQPPAQLEQFTFAVLQITARLSSLKEQPFLYCNAIIPLPVVLLTVFLNCLCLSDQSLCDYYGCEKENEQDDCNSGSLCKCKEGMERPNAQIPVCVGECFTFL